MTIILKDDWKIEALDGLTLKIAEAIKEAIKQLYGYELTIKEPKGGAQNNPKQVYKVLKNSLLKNLEELSQVETGTLLEQRFNKFRTIGQKYIKLEENNI